VVIRPTEVPEDVLDLLKSLNHGGCRTFLVGGCVRDLCLGRKPKDYDMVTTTPDLVEAMGFPKVGAAFPVWQTRVSEHVVEIAAARRETKVAPGYNGFTVEVTSDLKEDLKRRDLTINALAWSPDEGLIFVRSFWGKVADLLLPEWVAQRLAPTPLTDIRTNTLRAVGPAFAEDPLRVFRVAQFSARFGWDVAPETIDLMKSLKAELPHLTKERVRVEMEKALMSPEPSRFFRVLRDADALTFWFPEIEAMIGVTQPEQWHPEGDVFNHTMQVLDRARFHGANLHTMFAALAHDFGKTLTPKELQPKHHGHEMAGGVPIETFSARFDLGEKLEKTMKSVAFQHTNVHNITKLRPSTLLKVVKILRRNTIGLSGAGIACMADAQGRGPTFMDAAYPQAQILLHLGEALSKVEITPGWSISKIEQEQASALGRARKEFMDAQELASATHY
jgi:tRNA nucleotidyltransferase (CCA-adding enzyme)